jgi:hypothetical protein
MARVKLSYIIGLTENFEALGSGYMRLSDENMEALLLMEEWANNDVV